MNEEILRPSKPQKAEDKRDAERRAFRSRLVAWFKKNARDLPWRNTRDPYAVLVSEMMLQQTQVATVIEYFERWMRRFPDLPSLAAAAEADVLQVWQGLGYYSRARNLHRAAQLVMTRHAGVFPDALDAIRALPGVGRYTAGAVATFAFDHSTPIVDANIARVLARLFNMCNPIDTALGQAVLWQIAEELQPEKHAGVFNEAIMELGALICLPRAPKCFSCPVRENCRAENPESLPVKKARRKTVALAERCAWIVAGGRILLEQQTGPRWNGLWKLPGARSADFELRKQKPLLRMSYPFTHHRVALSIFREAAPEKRCAGERWFRFGGLDEIAIAAPHRRAIRELRARS